jgi:uncharacterized protein (TIGR02391 family)
MPEEASNDPTVAIKFSDGSLGIECGFCSATGNFPDTAYADPNDGGTFPCPVCNGIGFNILPPSSEGAVVCRCCGGDGKAADESGYFAGDTCPVCEGRGFLDLSAVRQAASLGADAHIWSLLHPEIRAVAKPRFDSGHFADAVEAAFKHFGKLVKASVPVARRGDVDGATLMERVFSARDPLLVLDTLETQSGRDEQLGYMKMFSGAITGIRNPKAHDNVLIDDVRALHLLFVASLFCFKLDDALRKQGDVTGPADGVET